MELSKIRHKFLLIFFFFQGLFFVKAQETVTRIYGDLGGFFTSSTSSTNTYDDSNNLLGFISGGTTFSTSVDDAKLIANGVSYTSARFLAFPMPASISYNSTELIGIGTNWDGVSQNNSSSDYIKTFSPIVPSFFVRDGSKGLELATNFFNIKSQVITYDAIVINQAVSINDDKPDIIVTQTGAPSSNTDKFKFIDVNGDTVGSELNVVFNGVTVVGGTDWTIYRVNPTTGVVSSIFGIDTYRDLRMLSFKLSDFGITTSNFSQISNFVHTISGGTDIAFTAYNSDSVEILFQPTDLEVSNSIITSDDFCSPTTASFTTTVTNNSIDITRDFEVEFQIPSGATFTSSSASFSEAGVGSSIASYSGIENKWTIVELSAGESITLTVNTSVSSTPFPVNFTAIATPLFQNDSDLSNNSLTVTETGNDSDCDGVLDVDDLDDDNDGILDSVEGTGDDDNDGIPNNLDLDSDGDQCPDALEAGGTVSETQLDSDYRVSSGVNGNGIPTLTEAGSGSGQAIGDSQNNSLQTCNTLDTDGDGYINIVDLDDDNDGILDTDEGDGNLDGDGETNNIDTDSDADGCPDALEGNANFTYADVDINNRLTGGVDDNGIPLVATSSGQTVGNSQNNSIQSTNCSLLPVIISQVYQSSQGNAIELTNIGSTTANNIRVALFKNIGSNSPSVITPTANLQVTSLAAGSSVLIKSSASLSGVNIINTPTEIVDVNLTDLSDADDTIILSTTVDGTSWANRYDVVSSINNESSFVRIDEVTKANTVYTESEWMVFIDDNIEVLGDTDPIPIETRHANAPLLSEVKTPNTEANNGLGLHRINPTIRASNMWSNGYPDKSRSVIIQESYTHSGNSLNARKLYVESGTLSIEDNPIVVVNDVNINTGTEIRILGTGQLIQTHEGASDVSGSGKLLIGQKSELPNTFRYNYWSSPVVEFPNGITYRVSNIMKDSHGELTAVSEIKDINFIDGLDGMDDDPIQVSNYWIYAFFDKVSREDWVQLKDKSFLDRGLGYTMKSTGENPQYFTFSGSPIDGDITFSVTGNTTSLIGNPYAGTLDSHAFILNNEDTIDGTLYFWEHTGESQDFGHSRFGYKGGYAQLTFAMATAANTPVSGIDGLGGASKIPSRYIAPGQGFFVSSDTDGGTISFSNKQRSYQSTSPDFFRTNKKSESISKLPTLKLGLNFKNENDLTIHRQIGVSFKENNSFGFEYGYESEMIDIGKTDMYFSFKEMDNKELVIAGVEQITDSLKVPITILINSNEPIAIKIDEKGNIDKPIYLYDAVQNTVKELKEDELLELELAKGTYNNRFFIVFSKNTSVLNDNTLTITQNVKAYINNNAKKIIINNRNLLINKVELYNVLGQLIKQFIIKDNSKELQLDVKDLSSSVYLLKIKLGDKTFHKKILKE